MRLAKQALVQAYGKTVRTATRSSLPSPRGQVPSWSRCQPHRCRQDIADAEFPLYAGSKVMGDSMAFEAGETVSVTVTIASQISKKPMTLTTDAPLAATQSSTLVRRGLSPDACGAAVDW